MFDRLHAMQGLSREWEWGSLGVNVVALEFTSSFLAQGQEKESSWPTHIVCRNLKVSDEACFYYYSYIAVRKKNSMVVARYTGLG